MQDPNLLDWRNKWHWGGNGRRLRCRYCHELTFLRDETGKPAHKVCAERKR